METYTVGLCYFAGIKSGLLEEIRARLKGFTLRTEYLCDALFSTDGLNRPILQFGRGFDLFVIVSDGAVKNSEFLVNGLFNHSLRNPWPSFAIGISSPAWKGDHPTIAVKSEHFLDHFKSDFMPFDFENHLVMRRGHLYDRGFSKEEWERIMMMANEEQRTLLRELREKEKQK